MRRTALIVGGLFWISNLVTLVGALIAGPIQNAANSLTSMYPHETQVVVGTLIAHINDAAIIGYAVLLYAVLRRFSEPLALGYVAFKVVEGILLLVSAGSLLSVIALSQKFLAAGSASAPSLQAAAEVALAQEFWAARLAALAYLVATPILCFLLFRSQIVPRFIAVWGFVALLLLATGLAMGIGDPTHGFQPGQVLVIPIILWELLFATWSMVKGFRASPSLSSNREVALSKTA